MDKTLKTSLEYVNMEPLLIKKNRPSDLFFHNALEEINVSNWLYDVQKAVNEVVATVYKRTKEERTASKILELMTFVWRKINVSLFPSQKEYYTIILKITDHLLQFLLNDKESLPAVCNFERYAIHFEEMELSFCVTMDLVLWSKSSYVTKKYLVSVDEDFLANYWSVMHICTLAAFQQLPAKMEVCDLITGKCYEHFPSTNTIMENDFTYNCTFQPLNKENNGILI